MRGNRRFVILGAIAVALAACFLVAQGSAGDAMLPSARQWKKGESW